MAFIYCPECNMLVGTAWFLWPNADNKLSFKCKRKLDTGEICKGKAVVSSKELMENNNTMLVKNTAISKFNFFISFKFLDLISTILLDFM